MLRGGVALPLEAAIASNEPLQILASLQFVLRGANATGRSTRGTLHSVLSLISSETSQQPSPIKLLAYEVLWTLTASVDAQGYRNLLSIARGDMLSADHPDLTLAALSTLRSMPSHLAMDLLLGEDADRSMVDAILGKAPPHVRAASIHAFSRLACAAYVHAAV